MTRIITYGTFDLFHVGHVRLLKRIKEMGTSLYVGVSSDEFNRRKGKKSFFSYSERAEIVQSCKYVDFVFPEDDWEQKIDDIRKYRIDTFVMGDDWLGKFDYLQLKTDVQVKYLSRTENVSTTAIKNKLSKIDTHKIDHLESQLHDILDVVKALKPNFN